MYKNKLKDINVRPETLKLLKENIGSKLLDITLSNIFFGYISLGRETKGKINKRGYFKLKRFCTVQETINKIKRKLLFLTT